MARKKIDAAKAKLAEIQDHAVGDGYDHIRPGGVTPVLMRDPLLGNSGWSRCATGVALPSWTDADEKKWDVTYNARRDKLSTAWRKLWVATHGVMAARRI